MRSLIAVLAALAMLVAACSTGGASSPGAGTADDSWRTASLRDVVTGEQFRIEDLKGKVVAIEAMAIWCSPCRIQQGEAQAALAQVASPNVVYISLDVDPNEREAELAEYSRREGFQWRFVVASPEMARSLASTFGEQVLSPPATPLIILDAAGEVIDAHIGIKRADDLAAVLQDHLP